MIIQEGQNIVNVQLFESAGAYTVLIVDPVVASGGTFNASIKIPKTVIADMLGETWTHPDTGIQYPGILTWFKGLMIGQGIPSNVVNNMQLVLTTDPALAYTLLADPNGYDLTTGLILAQFFPVAALLLGEPLVEFWWTLEDMGMFWKGETSVYAGYSGTYPLYPGTYPIYIMYTFSFASIVMNGMPYQGIFTGPAGITPWKYTDLTIQVV